MNTLDSLFKALAFGELSSIYSGVVGAGRIDETREEQVIHHANMGLLALYSRFVLAEKEVILDLIHVRTDYILNSKYALTHKNDPDAGDIYIRDTVSQPFINDVLRVLEVNSSNGDRLPLNDDGNPNSVFTPRPDLVQIPCVELYDAVSVIYQASHPKLGDDRSQEIILPYQLFPALTAFIGYKIMGAIGTDDSKIKSVDFANTYENICKEIERTDLVSNSRSTSTNKFIKNGWV